MFEADTRRPASDLDSCSTAAVEVGNDAGVFLADFSALVVRLADFIRRSSGAIASEWDAFARSLPVAANLSASGLRDHADEILTAIADDMDSPQSASEQTAKACGRGKRGRMIGVGRLHALLRTEHGFTLAQIVAEFRALRASVLRLWLGQGECTDVEGVVRFNEAIDEVLTESAVLHEEVMRGYRDRFMAVLAHDLRTPLAAIVMAATGLQQRTVDPPVREQMVSRIAGSAKRMGRLVDVLLDVTRVRLGGGLPIAFAPADAGAVCRQVLAELEGVHPGGLRLDEHGDLRGEWDGDRLVQMIGNLVANAVERGARDEPISILADGRGGEVVVQIHHEGPALPGAGGSQDTFDPFLRPTTSERSDAARVGLGLYIAREVAAGHGGTIDVTSSETEGTTFRVHLPRRPSRPAPAPAEPA